MAHMSSITVGLRGHIGEEDTSLASNFLLKTFIHLDLLNCVASNIVLQMNKLRFKDGKGDPRGLKAFLESEYLPRGFIP